MSRPSSAFMLNSLPVGTARPSSGSRVAASKQIRVDSHGFAFCSGRQRSTHCPSHGRQSSQPCCNTRLHALTQDTTQSYLREQDLFSNEEVDTSLQVVHRNHSYCIQNIKFLATNSIAAYCRSTQFSGIQGTLLGQRGSSSRN